jgi:hypothetical protein
MVLPESVNAKNPKSACIVLHTFEEKYVKVKDKKRRKMEER